MDEIVLQRISTSMSVENFQLSGTKHHPEMIAAEPVGSDNVELLLEIVEDLSEKVDNGHDSGEVEDHPSNVEELLEILLNYNFQALIEAHDLVANKTVLTQTSDALPEVVGHSQSVIQPNSARSINGGVGLTHDDDCIVRMVSIHPGPGSDLGMTVRCEKDKLIVARIMIGGLVDKQGMLHIGDVITHVNGEPVQTVASLQTAIQAHEDTLTFTVIPSWTVNPKPLPTYMKAFFFYDPQYDRLLPSRSIGLSFAKGDILEVFNINDDTFWQARHFGGNGSACRLIPSQDLQEIRLSRVRLPATPVDICKKQGQRQCDFLKLFKKHKKLVYGGQLETIDIDRNELVLYEEVVRVPSFIRSTVIFLGPSGTARQRLVSELIRMYPDRYGYPIPHTSRSPRPGEMNGRQYFFSTAKEMRADIAANRYVEHGEFNGNLYGTKLESVRDVVRSGKICLLDCGPKCLKMLRTREFLPFVVFVSPRSYSTVEDDATDGTAANIRSGGTMRSCTMENLKGKLGINSNGPSASCGNGQAVKESEASILLRVYEPFVDLTLDMDNFEVALYTMLKALEKSECQEQWIPASWIY